MVHGWFTVVHVQAGESGCVCSANCHIETEAHSEEALVKFSLIPCLQNTFPQLDIGSWFSVLSLSLSLSLSFSLSFAEVCSP